MNDYFQDFTAISASMLKVFRKRRRLYEAYYVTRSVAPPEPTRPMEIGTLAHAAILEPDTFAERYAVYPAAILAKNGAATTNAAKDFRDENESLGKIVVKAADLVSIQAMADSVKRVCGDWLQLPCKREHVLRWQHEGTLLPLKMKADWLIETAETVYVLDVKTTADASPGEFRRRAEDGSLWLQHSQYIEGVETVTGKPAHFFFVAVESEFPFQAAIYDLDRESAERGRAARERTLEQLADCLSSGDFSEEWEQCITHLSLRPWSIDPDYQPN